MTLNLAFRGYLNGQVIFEESFTYDHFSDGRDVALSALAKTHARVLDLLHDLGPTMLEIEFVDEPDPEKRFFRFGSDPSAMREPVEVDLEKGIDLSKWKG